jgi:hypothetical protein
MPFLKGQTLARLLCLPQRQAEMAAAVSTVLSSLPLLHPLPLRYMDPARWEKKRAQELGHEQGGMLALDGYGYGGAADDHGSKVKVKGVSKAEEMWQRQRQREQDLGLCNLDAIVASITSSSSSSSSSSNNSSSKFSSSSSKFSLVVVVGVVVVVVVVVVAI